MQLHLGWLPRTGHPCKQVDRLVGLDKKDAFHWVLFKEKMGSARFHRRWLREPQDPAEKDVFS